MSASFQITTAVLGSNLVVNASIVTPADIPTDIFLYDNTGTDQLGQYYGVANLQDYSRIQAWTGTPIPIFGNKYVKHTVANLSLPIETTPASITAKITRDLTQFRLEYLAGGTVTQVLAI